MTEAKHREDFEEALKDDNEKLRKRIKELEKALLRDKSE